MEKIDFRKNVIKILSDPVVVNAVQRATAHALEKRLETISRIPDFEELRDRAREAKEKVISRFEDYLSQFKENAKKNGFIVHEAGNADEARNIILEILRSHDARTVVSSKSMTQEEIEINPFLEAHGITKFETDLGEFIIQVAGQKPSHITAPAIHLTRREIAKLFSEKLGMDYTEDPEEITKFARRFLREKYFKADAGMSGANFLIADTGSFVVVENEGNARMSTTLPGIHIAVTGIEKLIPGFRDLPVFLKILAPSSTGQRQTVYTNIFSTVSPGREVHIVLIDNGRRRMLKDPVLKEALMCIRCGGCSNVCPIFQLVGGHAYGSVYSGPIGIIWTYAIFGHEVAKDLPFASTLCGACKEICPVRIDIPRILLELRRRVVEKEGGRFAEKILVETWSKLMTKPFLNRVGFSIASKLQSVFVKDNRIKGLPFILSEWTKYKDLEPLSGKTFREQWKKHRDS